MNDVAKAFAPELSPAGHKKWIGRLIVAVLAGAAIWNFLVALTQNVVLPGLARIMEADPQSPLYLGKGEFNLPALFAAILELCFALIAAILVNSWSQRAPRQIRRKAASTAPSLSLSTPLNVPVPSPIPAQPKQSVEQVRPPQPDAPKPAAAVPAPPAEAKPSKPKKVYYNMVGERVESDED